MSDKQAMSTAIYRGTPRRFPGWPKLSTQESRAIPEMAKKAKSRRPLPRDGDLRAANDACVEIFTFAVGELRPVVVTDEGLTAHAELAGCPLQLSDTLWLKPPIGVSHIP